MKHSRFLYFFLDAQHFRRFLWSMSFLAFLTGIGAVFIPQAWAASFSCTSTGTAVGNLYDIDTIGTVVNDSSGGAYTINTATATTNGDPFGTACPESLGVTGRVMCFFKSTVGQIVSTMYCGVQSKLIGPISLALELFIVIFGVTVMTGIIRFTPRQAILTLLKIALVWAFAMNATWGIGIGYAFFIGLAEQGSNLVLNAAGSTASGGHASGGGGYLTQSDNVLQGMFNLMSTGSGGASLLSLPSTLSATCGIWLAVFIILLLLFMPMVAGFMVTMVIQYVMLYVRAFLGYLTALVLISFLFILSPLFISFALFKITRPMFEQWMKYLVSFSVQMIIVFSFLVLLNLIPLGAFFSEMLGLLRQYDTTTVSFVYPLPSTFCSVCYYTLGSGNIGDATPPITCDGSNKVHPLGELFLLQDLAQAVLSQIVALWIIGTVMQDFMKQAPHFASELAGGMTFAAMLGGSAAAGGGGGAVVEYPGLDELDSEETMQKVRDKIEGWRSSMASSRVAPAILTTALLAGYAAEKKNGKAGKDGEAGSDGAGAGMKKNLKNLSKKQESSGSGKSSKENLNIMRPLLGMGTAKQIFEGMKSKSMGSTEYLNAVYDENENQVTQALQVATAYQEGKVSNPGEYRDALSVLRSAHDSWLLASKDLADNNERLVEYTQRAGIPDLPSTGGNLVPQNLAGVLAPDEIRAQADAGIKNLQMQIDIQRILQPGDMTERAHNALASATDALSKAGSPQELDQVLAHLNEVQKMLT